MASMKVVYLLKLWYRKLKITKTIFVILYLGYAYSFLYVFEVSRVMDLYNLFKDNVKMEIIYFYVFLILFKN